MLLAIPFSSFLIGLILGHATMRRAGPEAALSLMLLLSGGALYLLWRESFTVGLDVFVYTLAFWGAALPAVIASGMGALLGWAEGDRVPLRAEA
ncbi:hypothetical protein [Antarctobacter jejuensis]|uniref:hypothetical protein n=1 Tax=Antarctobacter jejuensis TaxID=1439938 RepID=UPI003FD530AF